MTQDIIKKDNPNLDLIKKLVTNGLESKYSKLMYDKAVSDFLTWRQAQGDPAFTPALVEAYKHHLITDTSYAPSTINQKLSAIRRLAKVAEDNNLMDPQVAEKVRQVSNVKRSGLRQGTWLSKEQAQDLILTPDTSTLKGLRDRAILAVLVGAGLRRSELSALTFSHIQQIKGRWALVDILGKRNKVRTVPIPAWVKQAIDEWATSANLSEGRVFRSITKGDVIRESMSDQAVADVVKTYAKARGFGIAPHDLRRTFAQLSHEAGGNLRQLQLALGHDSIDTTNKYLGGDLDYGHAVCDLIGLHLE